jgi:hypothetical protein
MAETPLSIKFLRQAHEADQSLQDWERVDPDTFGAAVVDVDGVRFYDVDLDDGNESNYIESIQDAYEVKRLFDEIDAQKIKLRIDSLEKKIQEQIHYRDEAEKDLLCLTSELEWLKKRQED